jgi:hypothetical protein
MIQVGWDGGERLMLEIQHEFCRRGASGRQLHAGLIRPEIVNAFVASCQPVVEGQSPQAFSIAQCIP